MNRSIFIFVAVALLASGSVLAQPPATAQAIVLDRDERLAVMRADVEKGIAKLSSIHDPAKLVGISRRDLTHAAHDLFVLSSDPAAALQAQWLITSAFDGQEMDLATLKFGTVSWNIGVRAENEDPNAIEFTCLPIGAVMTRYRYRLSPEFVQQIKPHLVAALVAVRNHRVGVSYTNIYLMQITNLLLIGQAIGDANSMKLAADHLDQWIARTRKEGIGEFNSPTYMETQINCVTTAYDCTNDPTIKAKLKHVLDLLWADACASYNPATQQLGGASSRDYSFMDGNGPVDRYLFLEGLRTSRPTNTLLNDMSAPFCDAMETDYRPSERMLDLARNPEKQFRCGFTWPASWGDRTYFSTAAFSLGSAATSYDTQDRLIGLRFGSGKPLPIVSIFLDPYDCPDGSIKEKGKDNHGKPVHWKMKGATVQDGGTVLGIEDISGDLRTDTASLGLNLILPANADGLWIDGDKIDPTSKSDRICSAKPIVIVREGNAAMAARLFDVGGFAGFKPVYVLKHDIDNGKAFRLVAYAFEGAKQKLIDHPVPAGFIIRAAECTSDAAFDNFVKRASELDDVSILQDSGKWSAHIGSISVTIDPKTGKPIERTVDGQDVHRTGLESVNGWDLADLLPAAPSTAP